MNNNNKIGVIGGSNNLRAITTLKEAIQLSSDDCSEVKVSNVISGPLYKNKNGRIYDHPKPPNTRIIFPRGSSKTFNIPYANIDLDSAKKLSPFLQAYYDFGIVYMMGKSYGWCDMFYSPINKKDTMELFTYRYITWFFNLFASNKYNRYIPVIPIPCNYQIIKKGWWFNA